MPWAFSFAITNASPIDHKSVSCFPVFMEVLYKHEINRRFVERRQQIRHAHTNSCFATWTMILSERCISFPNLLFLPFLSRKETAKSLEHTYPHSLHFPTHFFHLSSASSAVIAASSVGPPNLPAPFLHYTPSWKFCCCWRLPSSQPQLSPSEPLIHHSSANLTLKASPGFYLAVISQCKMFWDTLY